jgi:hypothetical protein
MAAEAPVAQSAGSDRDTVVPIALSADQLPEFQVAYCSACDDATKTPTPMPVFVMVMHGANVEPIETVVVVQPALGV